MTGWDEIAAELESRLVAAEAMLVADTDELGTIDVTTPTLPRTPPTEEQRSRLEAIERRFAWVVREMKGKRSRVSEELALSGKRRGAARSYVQRG